MLIVGVLVSRLFNLLVNYVVGFILVLCCFGGIVSNVVMYFVWGNVVLFVFMMVVSIFLVVILMFMFMLKLVG